jgi:hypothetical protein
MRCAGFTAAFGLVAALTLPSQIAKASVRLGSTTACNSRSLTPTRLGSFFAVVAAFVLLRTPGALAVTPLTDGNIKLAATAWIDSPAAAASTYGAISEWDVSAVTNMAALFYQKPTFNADIGKWNVASVANMRSAFNGAAAFNRDIGKWNVASVATLYGTFNGAVAFNADIGKWNVASVISMLGTFNGGGAAFNRDIGKWNVASVATLESTFNGAAAFNQDIGDWNIASVTTLSSMFAQAANFNRNVARWNVLRVTDFRSAWAGTGALSDCNKKALYAKWTPAFRAASPTFSDMATCTIGSVCTTCITNGNIGTAANSWLTDEACAALTYGSIGDWNTAAVSSTATLFAGRGKFAAPGTNQTRFNADISKWNVVGVSNMAEMFSGAAAFDRPIGSWSTASVSTMASMFAGAAAFNRPVDWNVMSVTSMANMFNGASAFNGPIGGWSTTSVANMNGMFRDASKFNQPIGGWNVAAVSDMGVIFSNAATFGQDVAAWNVRSVTALTGAFDSTPISVSPCAVYNAWGATLQAAYPTWRTLCLCGKVSVQLDMAANIITGAKSKLTAQLSAVPTDASVSLSAVPQKGAVAVPLVTQSGGPRGSADLPSTGTWDVQLSIDGQSCPSQPTNVSCMPTFVSTAGGGCECPTGKKNVKGICTSIDPTATPETACQVATFQPDPAVTKLTDSSTVTISFSDGRDPTNITVLMWPKVAIRSATASDTATLLGLGQVVPGAYEVELQEAGSRCTLVSSVAVGCSEGYVAAAGIGGVCTKDRTECTADQWRDPTANRCRQKPAVAVSGSSTDVSITVVKTNRTKTNSGTVQVRLTSGDIDPSAPVRWTAVLPRNTPWLSCNVLNGTVDGRSSTGTFVVDADASGEKDTGGASPLRSTITVTSTMTSATGPVQFMEGSDRRTIEVSVEVVAVAYLAKNDIAISSKEDRQPVTLSRIPVATSLVVNVVTYDCDRLLIERDQQLKLRLWKSTAASSEPLNITFVYAGNGSFNAEIPGTALSDAGAYHLEVSAVVPQSISGAEGAQDSTIALSLEIVDPSRKDHLVFGSIAAAVLSVLLIVMLIVACRNRDRMMEVVKNFFKLEISTAVGLLLDVWDIYGAPVSCFGSSL